VTVDVIQLVMTVLNEMMMMMMMMVLNESGDDDDDNPPSIHVYPSIYPILDR